MSLLNNPIGGYFELELPELKGGLYPEALLFQSARAAFYALLECLKPNVVWMPRYICDSMLAPLKALKIKINFYSLDQNLQVSDSIKLGKNDFLFYVNYFGICDNNQRELLGRYEMDQIIFDHSQAFYTAPFDCLATIYSPRKFFGVADGGILITKVDVSAPSEIDSQSVDRAYHLLKRLDSTPEEGYPFFLKAEDSLNEIEPKKMSRLTEKLLSSIEYEVIKEKRRENFNYLHEQLSGYNKLNLSFSDDLSPLIYPLLASSTGLKKKLLDIRVFTPTYWNDCRVRISSEDFEIRLIENLICIPCDQRYTKKSFKSLLKVVENEYSR